MYRTTDKIDRNTIAVILAHQSPEQKLESLERASRSVMELSADYGKHYLKTSFLRKRADDAQRASREDLITLKKLRSDRSSVDEEDIRYLQSLDDDS